MVNRVLKIVDASEPKFINHILIADDIVDPEWCDHLIKRFEEAAEHNRFKADVPSLDGTDNEVVDLTKIYVGLMNGLDGWEQEKKDMADVMLGAYLSYRSQFKDPRMLLGLPDSDFSIELPTIKRYVAGTEERIGPHSDTYMRGWEDTNTLKIWKGDRFLNILFYLNDVEEGGETEFYFNDMTISVPPKKGRIVVFPPLWTHIHAGMTPISGDKYIANGHLRATMTEQKYLERINGNPEKSY